MDTNGGYKLNGDESTTVDPCSTRWRTTLVFVGCLSLCVWVEGVAKTKERLGDGFGGSNHRFEDGDGDGSNDSEDGTLCTGHSSVTEHSQTRRTHLCRRSLVDISEDGLSRRPNVLP